MVRYGTSMTAVDSTSAPAESSNFTAKNFKVSITVRALTPNTMYFYIINASNTETSVISPIEIFITQGMPIACYCKNPVHKIM